MLSKDVQHKDFTNPLKNAPASKREPEYTTEKYIFCAALKLSIPRHPLTMVCIAMVSDSYKWLQMLVINEKFEHMKCLKESHF